MERKVRILTVSTLAMLGVFSISSGVMYSSMEAKQQQKKILVVVQEKRVSTEAVDLKLKKFELEVNTPLSVKITDYLDCAVTDEVLANLKLDTSTVNVTQPGTYTYTITYQDQSFEGNIVIKEPATTNENSTQTITLKTINIKVGTPLSTDLSTYVIEPLTDEMKAQMILDVSQVNITQAATYQYTITYQNSIYTSNIIVTNDQPTLSAGDSSPSTTEEQTPSESSIEEKEETTTTDSSTTITN